MKKILLGLIMLVTAATMNAQVELEGIINGTLTNTYLISNNYVGLKNQYVSHHVNDSVYIYDENFSLEKQFFLPKYPEVIAKNIFTTDGKICFVYEIEQGAFPDVKSSVVIVDEEGKIVNNIELEGFNEIGIYLAFINDAYKLLIPECSYANGECVFYRTRIYSCPGNGETTTSVENVPAKVKRNAYPNPANELVTLPYDANGTTSMKIYDMQGKLVERKFLDKNKQELQLNVKDYPSGMYFFEVNGESNSFIVE